MLFYPKLIEPNGQFINEYTHSTSKIVCVGRNYSAHAKELNNPIPKEPLLFIKSTNCLVDLDKPIQIPKEQGECHHELEISVLIGKKLTKASREEAIDAIDGIGLALDLTLREVQSKLKSKGQPWEKAKSFDSACPVSGFVNIEHFADLSNIKFCMEKNKQITQIGNSKNMLFDIHQLLQEISQLFSLYPGDIVLTGTPEGVAKLDTGDKLKFILETTEIVQTVVK